MSSSIILRVKDNYTLHQVIIKTRDSSANLNTWQSYQLADVSLLLELYVEILSDFHQTVYYYLFTRNCACDEGKGLIVQRTDI